jgi:hypothetical protein
LGIIWKKTISDFESGGFLLLPIFQKGEFNLGDFYQGYFYLGNFYQWDFYLHSNILAELIISPAAR